MHVLFATNNVFPDPEAGGSGRYVHETGQRLAERGHEVSVITRQRGRTPQRETFAGMSVFRYDGSVTSLYSAASAVAQWCERRHNQSSIDILNFHSVLSAILVDRALPRSIPRIYTFHGPWGAEYRERSRKYAWPLVELGARSRDWLEGYVLSKTVATVTLSSFMSQQLRNHHPHAPNNSVIPGGVDTTRFHPDSATDYSFDTAGTTFLTVRRLTPRMGLESLIEAFATVHECDADTHLYIAGDGPLRDALERQVQNAGLEEAVTFLGFVSETKLPGVYAGADVFVLPTTALEGFGLVTVEALASGTPVVGTDVGGTPEVLGPLAERLSEAPSLLVDDQTPMADRLLAWAECPPEVQLSASKAARNYVCTELTWEQTTDRLERIFRTEAKR